MPGGRRKSRKPQKWEDFLADEQLACLEKEMEEAEVCKEEVEDDSDGEAPLRIVTEEEESAVKVEEEEVEEEEEEKQQVENGDETEVAARWGKEEAAPPTAIGDCSTCGIQLRDWSSTHSHLRFHRLSHVPDCIGKASTQTKRINCKVCQRSCQTREVLAYHAYTEHYIKLRQARTCPFCCRAFATLEEFLDHLDISNISFKCEMCGTTVRQEHKFYQHIVYCTRKTHSGVTNLNLPCCVCGAVIKINRLYDHLINHSTQLNLPCHLASTAKTPSKRPPPEPFPPKELSRFRPFLCEMCDRRFVVYSEYRRHLHSHTKTRAYVCTHCGRGYCQKNTLIVHLYSYHNESPNAEEVTPREETPQRRCEACGRVGFVSEELLVRHCVMRCATRNNLQASFAVIIASIAKNLNTSFEETLRSPAMLTYLKLGLEAWRTPTFVRDYLETLTTPSSNPSINLALYTNLAAVARKESVEFTDIQLLAYLSQFEEKNKEDKERAMALNPKAKSEGQWGEGKTDDMVEDGDMEGGGEESLLPFLCTTTSTPTSPPTTSNTPPPPYTTTAPIINQASLMQHLRWGGERRGADQSQGGEGGGVPVDICLVTSTTNTQVTITPAGHHLTQDMRPPKIAKELPHKPSVAEIKAQYPGVTVLGDIDFSRLPFLMMEMQEFMSDRHERAMEAAGITAEVLQRLEVEAQLLREAEPFYLEDYPARSDREDKNDLSVAPSPTVLQKLNAEIEEMCEGSKDSDTHPHVSPLSPKVKGENEDRKRGENGHDGGQRNTDSPPLSPPRKRVKIETETQSTSNPEKCAGTSGSKRENVDSPLHSPSRKRRKIGTETQVKSPPEKCGGTSVSTISSAAQDALQHAPPKQLIERLLREARMLTEG